MFGALPILMNVPQSELQGVEAELQSSPIPGLFMALNAVYLNNKIGQYRGTDKSGTQRDLTGKFFNYAPALGVTLLANYTAPIGSCSPVLGRLQRSQQDQFRFDSGQPLLD